MLKSSKNITFTWKINQPKFCSKDSLAKINKYSDSFNLNTFSFDDDTFDSGYHLASNNRNGFTSFADYRNQFGGPVSSFASSDRMSRTRAKDRRQRARQGYETRPCSMICARECVRQGRHNSVPFKGGHCNEKKQCVCD